MRLLAASVVALLLQTATAWFFPRARPHFAPRSSALEGSKLERDLKVMSLIELKNAAESMGLTEPEGHKGRKDTWIKAILALQAAELAASAALRAKSPASKEVPPETPSTQFLECGDGSGAQSAVGADTAMVSFFKAYEGSLASLKVLAQPGSPALSILNQKHGSPLPPLKDPTYSSEELNLLSKTTDFVQQCFLDVTDAAPEAIA